MKNTLLLVDDNLANLAVLFDHLDTAGYHVLASDNGVDAIEQAVRAKPDLILLDVRMPHMDGYETCRAIKAYPDVADTPVIFLSALTDTDDRLRGFQSGAVDYVTKPVDAQEVTSRIRTHIRLAQLQHKLQTTNARLEDTVATRTAELQAEIEMRRQQQSEKEHLLQILQEQNQQLYDFTRQLLQSKPMAQMELAKIINQPLLENLAAISTDVQLTIQTLASRELNENNTLLGQLQTVQQRADQLQEYLHNIVSKPVSAETSPVDTIPSTLFDLSARQREVLRLICDGLTTAEIAGQLSVSDITIRTHRSRIMRKLNIEHLPGLIKFAIQHNLTSL